MALSDEVKARVSLRKLAEGDVTWDVHKSNPKRGDYWAPCPFHGEATASFHVTEPKGTRGVFKCFGCCAKGSCIDYLIARDGVSFAEAVKALADEEQIDRKVDPARQAEIERDRLARQQASENEAAALAAKNFERARSIWRASWQTPHPDLERYLEGRGIRLDVIGGVPPTLRYHPSLRCYEGGTLVHTGPAMVGFIGRSKMVGIHRTWIDGETRARLPDGAKVPKQFLGRTGEMFGHPVCLTPPKKRPEILIAGEGIETTLAALAATLTAAPKDAGRFHAEAALSLPALAGPGLPGVTEAVHGTNGKPLPTKCPDLESDRPGWLPPDGTGRVIILADPSARCPGSAEYQARRAEAKVANRTGLPTRLAVPGDRWDHDDDFADLAQKGRL